MYIGRSNSLQKVPAEMSTWILAAVRTRNIALGG